MIFLANLLGGASYPLQKWGLELMPPGTLSFARNAVCLVCLLPVIAWRRKSLVRWTGSELLRAFLIGSVGFALPLILGAIGLEYSTATNGSVLILLEPVTLLLFAWILLKKKINKLQMADVGLGIAGGLLLVLEEGFGGLAEREHFFGNVMLAVSAVAWGFYTPMAKPLLERHDVFAVTAMVAWFSLPCLGPYAWTERADWPVEFTPQILWMLLSLGGLVSFVGTLFWVGSLDHIPASWVAPFLLVQPLAGTVGGMLFFDERPTRAGLVGAGLIVTGLLATLWVAKGAKARDH